MSAQRIGVVMGGFSRERDVSLASGEAVAQAFEGAGYDVARVTIGEGIDTVEALRQAQMDVAFLALHGRYGEDGCIQGMLEILGIPYTGSGVMSSALAMDKLKSKELFRLHNVPTPPYYVFQAHDSLADVEEIHGSFGFPAIVKPRNEGSSIGVTKVDDVCELVAAIDAARELDGSVLIERYIAGREIAVGLLGDRVLGAIEIEPKKGIYDYEAKYTPGMSEYFMPARIPPTRYQGVLNLAARAAAALDTKGPARVDLIVTEGENEYVLEVNTLPGMTPTSLLPKIAQAAGFGFERLLEAIVGEVDVPRTESAERDSVVVEVPARRSRRQRAAG